MSWLQTWSGRRLDLLDPLPESINILDISHGLANECRFAGQCRSYYSVAQHSIIASQIVRNDLAMEALLHDAAEAYLKDIPTPLKALLPEYRVIEERLSRVIRKCFGLPEDLAPEIKAADLQLLATERRDLMTFRRDSDWPCLDGVQPLDRTISAVGPQAARQLFQGRFLQLALGAVSGTKDAKRPA